MFISGKRGCLTEDTHILTDKGYKKIRDFNDKVTLYKESNCGCCGLYTNYLRSNGKLNVDVNDMLNVGAIKNDLGVPMSLQSCHTTKIGSYFVEGHIPLEAINKLMAEKPDILGIAMPGMPSGSPGMPGVKTNDFVVYAVNKDGSQDVFMTL